jgi:AcrR family transcriptional regulator
MYLRVKNVSATMSRMAVEKLTPARRKERTRNALLDAAAEVFAQRGFNGASLEEIAETAGFTRGAIYKNFDNKEDLFFAVMDRLNEKALARFGERFDIDASALLDVHAIVQMWREIFVLDSAFNALLLEVHLYALRNPEIRERSLVQRRHSVDMVTEFMEAQSAASGMSLALPARTLAEIFLMTSDGFAQAAYIDPHAIDVYEKFLELMIPIIMRVEPGPGPSR